MACRTRCTRMGRSKHNCRKGRCASVRSPNCAITSNKAPKNGKASTRLAPLSGRCKRSAGVRSNALDHGPKAVRALWCEMFAQAHAFEHFDGVSIEDFLCALARIDSEQDRN